MTLNCDWWNFLYCTGYPVKENLLQILSWKITGITVKNHNYMIFSISGTYVKNCVLTEMSLS